MKYLTVRYRRTRPDGSSERRELLVEGDRRQTPEDMIHEALRTHFGPGTETVDPAARYRGPDGGELEVLEHDAASREQAESLRNTMRTRVVNRNITGSYCSSPYTG